MSERVIRRETSSADLELSHEALMASRRLKISLMTDGLAVDDQTKEALVRGGEKPLTLADYASTSGVTLRLPGDIWVNAPTGEFNSNFVESPPNRLIIEDGQPSIVNGPETLPVEFIPVPDYHDKCLSDGSPVTNIAITHSDRVRVSPIMGCAIQCDFCDIPFDKPAGTSRYRGRKSIDNLLESTAIALQDAALPAQHILISGGTPRKPDYGYENEVYEAVAQTFQGVDVDIMMVPMPGLLDAARLRRAGIHGLCINLELYNEEIAKKIMRSKAKASRQSYFDFIEGATEEFGPGKVRSLMLVGLEPIEDTLRGVEELAKRGCDPILSPFRPDPITPLRDISPPSADQLMHVWQASQEIVARYPGVVLGPRCIPCMHNCLAFPDDSGQYYHSSASEVEAQIAS